MLLAPAFAQLTTAMTTAASATVSYGALITASNSTVAAAQSSLQSAYSSTSASLQTTITQFQNFGISIRAFQQSLMFGTLSTLSPEAQYQAAQSAFKSTSTAAKLGDLTAIGNLQQASTDFLNASKAYNASGAQYSADFSAVQQALTATASLTDRQTSIAQQQLDSLNMQVSALITINSSVLSVAAAIATLNAATTAASVIAASAGGANNVNPGGNITTGNSAISNAQIRDYVAAATAATTDPMVAAMNIYNAAKTNGVSMAQFDIANGNPVGTSAAWATANGLPTFAKGGLASGLSLVGEQGPELVDFKSPGRVYTAGQTSAMLGGNNDKLENLLTDVIAELRAANIQRGAAANATIDSINSVADKIDGTRRTIARAA